MRNPTLDVLRFLAIALVLGRHAFQPEQPGLVQDVMALWCRIGWAGVDLFFVLSGYLIGGLLIKEEEETGTVNVGRFLLRRAFKIYPAYWCLLLLSVGTVLWRASGLMPGVPWDGQFWGAIWKWLWPNLLFVQNYVQDQEVPIQFAWSLRMTWSLAVEEHFYVFLPLLIHFFGRHCVPAVWAFFVVLCLALRFFISDNPFATQTHLMPTHLRIDALLFGVMLCYVRPMLPHDEGRSRWWLWFGFLGGLVVLFSYKLGSKETWMLYTVASVAFSNMMRIALDSGFGFGPISSVFAWLGRRSYSIYLSHVVTAWWAGQFINPSHPTGWWLWTAAYMGGAIALGCLLHACVEQPFLRLRDRISGR